MTDMKNDNGEPLRKCTRCNSVKLETGFNKNSKGNFNKLCINCLSKSKASADKNRCPHGKHKNRCKDGCGGVSICEHGKQKHRCKEGCGGSTICVHNRRKYQCRDCGGVSICSHGVDRRYCKPCGGSSICSHNKLKASCRICSVVLHCPSENCDFDTVYKRELTNHIKICTNGRIGSSGEVRIKTVLEQMKIEYEYDTSYMVKADRPLRWDFIIKRDPGQSHEGRVFIEFDGKQHFKAVPQWGGQEALTRNQAHDKIKDDFCRDNCLPFLRIKYTEYENIEALIANFARTHMDWGFE